MNDLSRRTFIGAAAAVGAGLAADVVPAPAARGARRAVGANDKLVLGLIGCGGMGAHNMRALMEKPEVEVAALCDVDEARMPGDIKNVTEKYGKAPTLYRDYRKMLERKDIDAVIIGTPDHWHALNLIHAVEAGKDAYCEKPISHSIVEAKSMAAAVRRFGRIVQVGTWQRSTPEFTNAVAYVRAGKLGKVVLARAWKTDPFAVGNVAPTTPPAGLDYDFWTGPAAMLPYAPNHVHGNWRWFLNYGSGMTGDWGVHMMDIALLGLSADTDLAMPTEVTSYGGRLAYPTDDRTAPDTVQSLMRFAKPDVMLHWQTGRDFPGRPDHGTEFVSAEGKTLRVWRGGWHVMDPSGELIPPERVEPTNDHWQNWLDCVKSREQPRSHLASMAQTTIVCHLANCSLLAGSTVRWDKAKNDIVGRAGKDALCYAREYRKPWKLPIYK